jgi:hypothetical protein
MSKTAEERIVELETQLKDAVGTSTQLRDNYNQLYRHAQESERTASYYRGQLESTPVSTTPAETPVDMEALSEAAGSVDINAMIERAVEQRVAPRLQQVEQYAVDALQQTAGREVDRALVRFKETNPEAQKIMDFERLVLMDASDTIKRKQARGEVVDDIKDIAVHAAQERLTRFSDMTEKVAKENSRRKEDALKKAMLPDVFASAGFEEAPTAPESAKEAGDLLEQIVKSRSMKGAA